MAVESDAKAAPAADDRDSPKLNVPDRPEEPLVLDGWAVWGEQNRSWLSN